MNSPQPAEPTPDDIEQALMHRLALDAAAAEVAAALQAAGIPTLLLKGPVVAVRLYDLATERTYNDFDLLIPTHRAAEGERVVTTLGFTDLLQGARASEYASHAKTFGREGPHPAYLDLHRTLPWCPVAPEKLWRVFSARATSMVVAGHRFRVPDDATLVLILSGHAVQHSFAGTTTEDLERAAERLPLTAWREAARLADELEAGPVLAAAIDGLARRGRGITLPLSRAPLSGARQLELVRAPVVYRIERMSTAGSLTGAASVAFRSLVPTPAYMRFWAALETQSKNRPVPLGGRGATGLLLAYLTRLVRRGILIPGALREWRSSRGAPALRRDRRPSKLLSADRSASSRTDVSHRRREPSSTSARGSARPGADLSA